MSKPRYKIIDRGWIDIHRSMKRLKEKAASVGIQEPEAAEDHGGISNAAVGAIHEYGTSKIPERSWLRSTFDDNEKKYFNRLKKAYKKMLELKVGKTIFIDGQLILIGELFRRDILRKINSGIEPPLSPATIARKKGEETPLIDTGQLRNSITSMVVDRGAK